MSNLNAIDLKTFVPAQDYHLSKQFYQDIGFTMASEEGGVAFFHHGSCSFLLQDFYQQELAENFMMHLLVEDIYAWHQQIIDSGVVERYGVRLSSVQLQPWKMLDFTLNDPSGVLWRIGQNS